MVYVEALVFILAIGIVFAVIFFLTPFLYEIWHDNLRPKVTDPTLQSAGDNFFNSWLIMAYVVPGVLIAWYFATAARKRTREDAAEF